MAAGAKIVDVEIRCTAETQSVITDMDHPVIAGVGAARSMKTHTGGYWALHQWMMRGGPSTISWFLGPELDRAFILVEKWCDGEGDTPPICPPELIRSRPNSPREPNPVIEMIDGHKIQIKHTSAKGKNLTGRGIVFAWWTEAATTSSVMNFVRVRGRIVQSRGQIYLDAVPEARNWVKQAILDGAVAEAEEARIAAANGSTYRRTFRVVQLSSLKNVWVHPDQAEDFMRDLTRIDPNIAAREAGGEWVDDRELLYPMFDVSRHTFDPDKSDPLAYLGLTDCTEQASLRWFARAHPHLIGLDVNARPHTALVGKIAVRKGESPFIPKNWILVLLDVIRPSDVDSLRAACEIRDHANRSYADAGVVMDATSTQERHNAGGQLNARINMMPLEAFQRAGFETRGPMRQKHDPNRFANPTGVDATMLGRSMFSDNRIMVNRQKCMPFVNAMRNQMSMPDGMTPEVRSNTVQDRDVAAFTVALKYLSWPFFWMAPHVEAGTNPGVRVYG